MSDVNRVIEKASAIQAEFDKQFGALMFATFALSIQFSPSMGYNYKFILLASWLAFSISAYYFILRIQHIPSFHNKNADYLRAIEMKAPMEKIKLQREQLEFFGQKKIPKWQRYQLNLFYLGVVLNLLFIAINYV